MYTEYILYDKIVNNKRENLGGREIKEYVNVVAWFGFS